MADLTGIAAIAGGDSHTVALKDDGMVWAWGRNYGGQLGDGTLDTVAPYGKLSPVQVSALTNVTAIAGRQDHSLALKRTTTPSRSRVTWMETAR